MSCHQHFFLFANPIRWIETHRYYISSFQLFYNPYILCGKESNFQTKTFETLVDPISEAKIPKTIIVMNTMIKFLNSNKMG